MNSQQSILVVDDDLHVLEVIEARLSSSGFQVCKASGAQEALGILKDKKVDLIISDIKMPGMGGMDLLKNVRSLMPGLPLIFLTAYGTIPDAVRAVKAGAVDYLAKPFDGRDLIIKIRKILKNSYKSLASGKISYESKQCYFGESSVMQEMYALVERIAASNVNVLILGESGSGKEHIARIIYQQGIRKEYPFVVVDCGSTPVGLLESELFGHVRGAFTQAIRDKKGLIETANHGTLFLDEIGNISPDMQVRFLRFLEDRKIRRVGDLQEIPVDCRIIAATNSDLLEDIKAGKFREDLYYRLRVVTLKVPRLRDRKEDIPLLARHFVDKFCESCEIKAVELPSETIKWLCNYPWPGNVRELKNALEAGVVLCKNGVLSIDDIYLAGLPEVPYSAFSKDKPFSLEETERNAILRALKEAGGIQKDAAQLLGISRRAIHYKIKKFDIDLSKIR
ncbi:MAG: sigma-54-dependent Fis family transcriptional regulator [Desulfobacteraceae bacterium]|nr:sigma-54-dependent Fis family transcriptional regulator [Desulfobacteraceae bacterium]MBC2720455.1 sigma-54-dependent Fis family transcriptional regulator [Desulfobacteraceae bacterium]